MTECDCDLCKEVMIEDLVQRVQLLNFENDTLREEIARLRDPTRQGDKT